MNTEFKHISFPSISLEGSIPNNIELKIPPNSALPHSEQHYLLYIPWHEKYRSLVPEEFQNFFSHVLPHLHFRTTDVHTAVCMSYLEDAIAS